MDYIKAATADDLKNKVPEANAVKELNSNLNLKYNPEDDYIYILNRTDWVKWRKAGLISSKLIPLNGSGLTVITDYLTNSYTLAFDENTDTMAYADAVSHPSDFSVNRAWYIGVRFKSKAIVSNCDFQLGVKRGSALYPTVSLQYSDDGTVWNTVSSLTTKFGEESLKCSDDKGHLYWRLYIDGCTGYTNGWDSPYSCGIHEMQLMGAFE